MKPPSAYAMHYGPPRPPVLFRFRSPKERDTYVAEFPHYRRSVAEPLPGDWITDSISLENGTVFHVAFRTVTLDDIAPVLPLANPEGEHYNVTSTP